MSRSLLLLYCLLSFLTVVISVLLISSWRANLFHIPGPFLARYTDAWTLYSAWRTLRRGDKIEYYNQLQARYGDVIRIGPKSVLVLDPAAVPVIYGVRAKLDKVIDNSLSWVRNFANGFIKGPAYVPFRQAGVTTSILSLADEKTHSQYRKLVSNAYSMSSLKAYEPYVDLMVNRLVEVCDQHANSGEPLNISLWCHYCKLVRYQGC